METNTQDNSKEEIIASGSEHREENALPPKSLEEQAIETGGTLLPASQTIRHDN